jgi:hypothetical protein
MVKYKRYNNTSGMALVLEVVLIALVLLMVVVAAGSAMLKRPSQGNHAASPTPAAASQPLRGVALSPKAYNAAGFVDFYEQAKALGTSVSWHGDWSELGDQTKAPYSVPITARKNGLEPIILVGTQHIMASNRADFKRWALQYVKQTKPRYFGMGNEVNVIAANSPAEFEALVSLVNETAAEIKQASPETKVFVTFQLERLKGLNGGLFGGKNDTTKAQWGLLKRFTVDVLAFTTYPGLIHHSPDEIPEDYYSEIRSYTQQAIAFSEVGWPAASVATGWPSTQELQKQFAARFLQQTAGLAPEFSVWLLLYDAETGAAFKSMGLMDQSGSRRPAYAVWKSP